MKELPEFKKWLRKIIETNAEEEIQKFVWELMKSPYVEFHYELLKDSRELFKDKNLSDSFRRSLRARFKEHGENAENLLISKLDGNNDGDFHGEIIFMLGVIKGKQKTKTLEFTRKLAENENDYIRERALIVLGWIGATADTKILEKHLLNDTHLKCRAWSASAYMQMWFRNKSDDLKIDIFRSFQKALNAENNFFVLAAIIEALKEIGSQKFGISQAALNDPDKEKIDIAKAKASLFLDKALKN